MHAAAEDIKEPIGSYSVEVLYNDKLKPSCAWKYFGKMILIRDGKRKHICTERVFCKICLIIENAQSDSDDPDEPQITKTFASCYQNVRNYSTKVSTGNLATHLSDSHKIELTTQTKQNDCKTLDTFFDVRRTGKRSVTMDKKRWLLARDLALWFCRSLLPFDLADDTSTNDFMKKYKVIGFDESLPVRTTVSREALKDVYQVMVDHVKQEVVNISPFGCITCDAWTDKYKKNTYITFTYHAISDTFQSKRYVLQTQVCYERKTAAQICAEVRGVLERFNLLDKDITYVHDAGSNMVAGIRLLGAPSHLCLGHGIHNLVGKDGIQGTAALKSVCAKSNSVCKTVRYRAPDIEREAARQPNEWLKGILDAAAHVDTDETDPVLKDSDDLYDTESSSLHVDEAEADSMREGIPPPLNQQGDAVLHLELKRASKTVKLPVPTRWHTLLIMLESLQDNKSPINLVLGSMGKHDLRLSQIEWKTVHDLINFLKTFRHAVEMMSAEKSSTINLALLLRTNIIAKLDFKEEDTLATGSLKQNMLDRIEHRFPVTPLLVTAALLDPRCSDLKVVNEFVKNKQLTKEQFLAQEINLRIEHFQASLLSNQDQATSTKTSATPQQVAESETAKELMELSRKYSESKNKAQIKEIEKEIQLYLSTSSRKDVIDNDILRFWRERKSQFPWLATLARRILCIQATSTPSERVFSIAGLILSAKRNRLDPAKLDMILFIHDNYELCSALFN